MATFTSSAPSPIGIDHLSVLDKYENKEYLPWNKDCLVLFVSSPALEATAQKGRSRPSDIFPVDHSNESERYTLEFLKTRQAERLASGCLDKSSEFSGSQRLSDELDLVVISPTGVHLIEIGH